MLETAFSTILRMTITGSVAGVIIILFRQTLGNKLPKKFIYAMWTIVLIRLLIPFSFASTFSIFNILPSPRTAITENQLLNKVENNAAYYKETENITRPHTQGDTLNNAGQYTHPQVNTKSLTNQAHGVVPVIPYLWFAGVVISLGISTYVYFKISRRLKTTVIFKDKGLIQDCGKRLQLNRKITAFTSDKINTPVVWGFFRPKIIIPLEFAESFNEESLRHIITHELVHIKRFDYLIKPLSVLTLCMHWFNPFVWMSFTAVQKDMEMSCDERVLSVYNHDIRREYATSLISIAERQNKLVTRGLPGFGESNIKSRVKGIMTFRRPGGFIGSAAIIALVILGLILLTNGQNTEMDKSGEVIDTNQSIETDNRFAIYLVKDLDPKAAAETDINDLQLQEIPIITDKDIKAYRFSDHSFELNNEEVFRSMNDLVPVTGIPFVVVADGERIYIGAFWTTFSSYATFLPHIDVILRPFSIKLDYVKGAKNIDDPRSDKRIYNVLNETGKLSSKIEIPSTWNTGEDTTSGRLSEMNITIEQIVKHHMPRVFSPIVRSNELEYKEKSREDVMPGLIQEMGNNGWEELKNEQMGEAPLFIKEIEEQYVKISIHSKEIEEPKKKDITTLVTIVLENADGI